MSAEGSHKDDCNGPEVRSHKNGKHGHILTDQCHGNQESHKREGHCYVDEGHKGDSHEGHEHRDECNPHRDEGQGHCHKGHEKGEDHGHGHQIMDAKAYTEYWKTDDVIIKEPHECLIKYQENILRDGMERLKILVPMCGRVFELKYFADLGHEVVGVEFAEIAIQQFFKIFDIGYETDPIDETTGTVYRSTDDKLNIRIYCCDVFMFGPHLEKDFRAVWDSGAMHSLQKNQMMDYVRVMKSVQHSTCKSLVEFTHPSCCGVVSAAELQSMYGEDKTVKELGYTKTARKYFIDFEIEGFYVFLVSPK